MNCYNPFTCRHISNCSSLGAFTQCEASEHHLELLDIHFYSEFMNTYCYGFTCCEMTECNEVPFRFAEPPPPHMTWSPTLIVNTSTDTSGFNRNVKLLLFSVMGGFIFILTLSLIKVNWHQKKRTVSPHINEDYTFEEDVEEDHPDEEDPEQNYSTNA